jgi:hypothetical protein
MSESEAANDTFVLEQWKHFRAEMNEVASRCIELERYALFSTGAIWAWLGTTVDADWHPAMKWLPLLLNAFFALRALGLLLRAREIASSLAMAETHFSSPAELRFERTGKLRGIRMVAVWVFWPLLLAVTLVLPLFYADLGPDSDSGQGRTLTFRSTHTPSTMPRVVPGEDPRWPGCLSPGVRS